jgi:hypothetical protein
VRQFGHIFLPEPSAAARERACKQQLQELILHMRDLSDHLIREGTAAYDPHFPASLVSEWQPEHTKYRFPFALVWGYDQAEQERRSSNQQLASYQKQSMPLLPFWTFGTVGDGSCTLHSIVAQAAIDGSNSLRDAVATVLKLPRTLWGTMRGDHAKALKETLKSYADWSVSSAHTLRAHARMHMAALDHT